MKTLVTTVIGMIALVILSVGVIGFIFWSRLPDVLANHLAKTLQVSVEIDGMDLAWGVFGIQKVVIGNPPGTVLSEAFSCTRIDVRAPFQRYLDQDIVIDQMTLSDVYLGLEFNSASTAEGNWTRIMANVSSSAQTHTGNDAGQKDSSKGKSVCIRSLVFTNISVDVVYRKEGGKIRRLPPIDRIELTNVTSEGGLPMDQVMDSVLGQMLKEVFIKQNLKNMLDDVLDPNKNLKNLIQPFKGLLNRHSDCEKAVEEVKFLESIACG